MARNPGRFVQVTEGVHKDKKGFLYNNEQEEKLFNAGKALVWLPHEPEQTALFGANQEKDFKKVLIQTKFLKVIGFID